MSKSSNNRPAAKTGSKPKIKKTSSTRNKNTIESKELAVIKTKTPNYDKMIIVGVGSSAGGLEALTLLIQNIPDGIPMSFVVAQHLDPKRGSMLVPLLERHAKLEVVECKNNEPVRVNKIYITPPNKLVSFKENKLILKDADNVVGPKPSIDLLFTSLAEEKAEKAIGIILSGTGSDGAHGIRAIKAAGGITIVQEESTAKFDGMPHAAILTGFVDLVLSPEEIGAELTNLSKYPLSIDRIAEKQSEQFDFNAIMSMLLQRTGCDFSEYKESTISRRIERRMAVNKLEQFKEYVSFLRHSKRELDVLYKDILISVTSFFRDKEPWESLKSIVSEVVKYKKQGDSIRIWVPGCATGEEAYSIAILFMEELGVQLNNFKLQIYGTDLDQEAIDYARRAVYPEATIVGVRRDYVDKYFTKIENKFQVITSIREKVIFARHNLITDPPFLHLDLVTCRNLMIYFKTSLQRKVFPIFHYALNPSGYLMLGKHEAIGDFYSMFFPLEKSHKIYQRRNSGASGQLELRHKITRPKIETTKKEAEPKPQSIEDLTNLAIVAKYNPPTVVIDRLMNIKYIRGDVSKMLVLKPGKSNLNILNLVVEQIRVDLRVLLHRAFNTEKEETQNGLRIEDGEMQNVINLTVAPLPMENPNGEDDLFAVIFEEAIGVQLATTVINNNDSSDDPRIVVLEAELNTFKERLHTTVQELETANEELQSMNEELQSSNEELQSANEELETSNEELQATNEELITVNEEFQVKSTELAVLNTDLENVLNSIDFPMIVVDNELKVTRFTPQAQQVFNLKRGDIGQVLTAIGCKIEIPNLRRDIISVIQNGQVVEKRVGDEGMEFWMNIYPYYSEHNKIVGAVLSLMDKSELIRANESLHIVEARLKKVFEFNPSGMAITDTNSRIIDANSAFAEFLDIKDDVKNKLFVNIPALKFSEKEQKLIVKVLCGDLNYYQIEKQIARKNEKILVNITISVISETDGKAVNGLVVLQEMARLKPNKKKQIAAA